MVRCILHRDDGVGLIWLAMRHKVAGFGNWVLTVVIGAKPISDVRTLIRSHCKEQSFGAGYFCSSADFTGIFSFVRV